MQEFPSQRVAINKLYRDVDGWEATDAGNRQFNGNLASTYGELTPLGVQRLLKCLQFKENDVFYDLGSGVGKVVLQVAMAVSIQKCVGVELVASRCRSSKAVLRTARAQGLVKAKSVGFRWESFLDSNISDATVVYMCSTCYSTNLMRRIVRKIKGIKTRPVTVITLRKFDRNHRGFQFIRNVRLDASWSRNVEAAIYKLN